MSDEQKNHFKLKVLHESRKPTNKRQNDYNKYRTKSVASSPRRNNCNKDKRSRSASPVAQNLKLFMIKKHDNIGRPELIDLELLDAESIIIFFSKNKNAFEQLLIDVTNLDIIILFLRVISKICTSSFQKYKSEIIIQIWLKDFLQKLQQLISELVSQKKTGRKSTLFFWENQNRFWKDLLILYKTIFEIVPRTAFEKLLSVIKINQSAIKNIHTNMLDLNLTNILSELEMLTERIVVQNEQQSFRNLKIFPTAKEITTKTDPFIRPNISTGSYSSVEMYLDIHFRLVREDSVRSLWNNICTYLKNQTKYNVYENVKFIQPVIAYDRICILVKVNFKNDNKFEHGTLICFSRNNFETVAYGTLIVDDNQKSKYSFNEYIIVDVIDTVAYNENYVMVLNNSSVDNTIQILKALQNMKEENFPMKQYIVDVNKQIGLPKYMNNNKKLRKKLMNEENQYFELFSNNAEYPKLNSSQYEAFQTALTRELSIIQGPPGTGKTYTTLKIVEYLLQYKKKLKYQGPILIICYSNYALDQFLEGILPFCKNIVRVGKDSENSKINNLNLRNQTWRYNNDRYSYGRDLLETEKEKIEQIKQKIQCLQNLLEDLRSKSGIINFKLFKYIDDKLVNTWFDYAQTEDILQWLMIDLNVNNPFIETSTTNLKTTNSILYSKSDGNVEETRIIDANKSYDSKKDFINNCILTIPKIKENIELLQQNLFNMKTKLNSSDIQMYEIKIQQLQRKLIYLQKRLNEKGVNVELLKNVNYNFPQILAVDTRWALYHNWTHLLHLQVYQDIAILDKKYREHKKRQQEVQHMVDFSIMNDKEIIGMTTSEAASLQPLLQTLKCQIVIVEEAAEILESHIVASLTNHCQQLILIGDHFQLRPNTSEPSIAKDFNLEISLFERLINNGIPYHQLKVQHRMRPEFAELITPSIYSNLQNADSVKNYPPVRGISKNLFFVTHKSHENRIPNSTSLKNTFEVKYIIKLAVYLIKQDYKTEEITILSTYKKQMEALESESKSYPELQNIRIATVDNFQGEENRIILLSLVRSNEKENIGFLKIEKRVCVALSRAKEGFYIVGNLESFAKSSKIWPKVIDVLTRQNAIGPALILKCEIHNNETRIVNYTDFDNIPEGGCGVMCGQKLICGHTCKLSCHKYDRNHKEYVCKERCNKILCERKHKCPKSCSDACDKCVTVVDKCLPCGHFKLLPCFESPWEYKCVEFKNITLPCNHKMQIKCYENVLHINCSFICEELLDCGHKCKRKCHINNPYHEQYKCEEQCGRKLPCNHLCKQKCFMPCGHCQVLVNKIVPACGHIIKIKCNEEPLEMYCNNPCSRILICGHECQRKCNDQCVCARRCDLNNEADCGCCIII